MSDRFRAEARALARLSHANIASLYSLIEDEEGLYLVLEYVEGNTLAALLATSGPLPVDTAFALFHQVLDGVGHAHEAGIVHRDLKPANLMVDARGRVKVMDFGIARMAGAVRTTHHGKLVGTPEYMSPEQVRGEDATIRSDIYSLGIVLFEMLTGQPPFRATASFELMRAQIEDAPPDPRALRPEIDPRVSAALLRALAKRPADRFVSTRELQEALLDAGASRRGRELAAVWREVPRAVSASEAPTLASANAYADPAPAGTLDEAPTAGAARGRSETLHAWERAVDALDQDIDAALGSTVSDSAADDDRAKAPTTRVIDSSQDTSVIEPRPTRLLDSAPFAAQARALGAAQSPHGAKRPRGWLWAAAAALAIALFVGWIQLRSAETDGAAEDAPRAEPPRTAETAPIPSAPAGAAPPQQPGAPAVAPEPPAAPAPVAPKKRAAPPPRRSEPAPAPQEESGWVIRR
jgi:hypothetical protein